MTTFSQWYSSFTKSPKVRPLTWVCGSEKVLVEDIVHTIVQTLSPSPLNYITQAAGDYSERLIWDVADQHPIDPLTPRVVVIRNAEKLKDTSRLLEWVKFRAMNPTAYLVLVSGDDALPRTPKTSTEPAKFVPWLAELTDAFKNRSKVHAIECKSFTMRTASTAVQWVESKVKLRPGIAGHLLNRANGDLRVVRDTLLKLAVFPDEITKSVIDQVLEQTPRETFVDALMAVHKQTALDALKNMPESEYARVIGLLDARLDLAGLVHDMKNSMKKNFEIVRAAGDKGFLVPDLLKVSKYYDARRRFVLRSHLAFADEALHSGARVGVLETLVALW